MFISLFACCREMQALVSSVSKVCRLVLLTLLEHRDRVLHFD